MPKALLCASLGLWALKPTSLAEGLEIQGLAFFVLGFRV